MGKTAFPYCLYEEGEVINDAEYTVFEFSSFEYVRWESYRFVLTSIIASITVDNIIGVIISGRGNRVSVANYVERILRMMERDLKAAKHIGVPA